MRLLGLSAYYHDSAAALVHDGEIVAAAQEERFTRVKHDPAFPVNAIQYCLAHGDTRLSELDAVVFYDKPFVKFERILETYLAFAPRGFKSFTRSLPAWVKEKLFQKQVLRRELRAMDPDFPKIGGLMFAEHHQSHAASAFFPSPFEEALVLTLDGVGEWTTGSIAVGSGNRLRFLKEMHFPHSLGLLYSAFTQYCGFKVNSGEYKLMGLAPYGTPKHVTPIRDHLLNLAEDGSLRLDMGYFDFCVGESTINDKFCQLFGRPARTPDADGVDPFYMDIAASIQALTEEVVIKIARHGASETGMRHLCLAGGVALNCVANGRLRREGLFEDIWIQPAAGDAGGAVGAALAAHHEHFDHPRDRFGGGDAMSGGYLGPEFSQAEIEERLERLGANFTRLSDAELLETVADALADGKVVGWFQGRMEFGPRALGARSILADPRRDDMQRTLNLKIKFREGFRPFAPAVLEEEAEAWFEQGGNSPYMLMVAPVHPDKREVVASEQAGLAGFEQLTVRRSQIPAVTHVDNSARVQTVSAQTNPRFHALISAFARRTACPVLVNTSFNVRGEPIVCDPEDAFRCLMGTHIDMLAIGNAVLYRDRQDPALALDYRDQFDPD